MWGGSDGVDRVAIEVLQHGVANRGSHFSSVLIISLCAETTNNARLPGDRRRLISTI